MDILCTVSIQLSPSELIEKPITLIPPRSSPLLCYGGVFAPNFKRHAEIVRAPCKRKRKVSGRREGSEKYPKSQVSSGTWARLLKRIFAIDVSRCPRCGSDLEVMAAVLDPIQIAGPGIWASKDQVGILTAGAISIVAANCCALNMAVAINTEANRFRDKRPAGRFRTQVAINRPFAFLCERNNNSSRYLTYNILYILNLLPRKLSLHS